MHCTLHLTPSVGGQLDPVTSAGDALVTRLLYTAARYSLSMLIGVFVLKSIGVILKDYFIKNPYIDTSTALFAMLILIIFGGIAGYIPAKRAARIKPIVALRDE